MSKKLYDASTFPLVAARTPLLPIDVICDIFAAVDPVEALLELLKGSSIIRQALFVASPSLGTAVDAWCESGVPANESLPLRVIAYLSRMSARATPLGICAGVGLVEVGDKTTLALAGEQRGTRTRVDMQVASDLIDAVESGEYRGRVRYRTNDAVVRRGRRLYVANVLLANYRARGTEQRPVTLKETEAVAFVREVANDPITHEDLVLRLRDRFSASEADSTNLLDALIESGVLLSEFNASPLGDPTIAILSRLAQIHEALASPINEAINAMRALDAEPVHERTMRAYVEPSAALAALVKKPPKTAIQVDMHAPLTGLLNVDVVEDIAQFGELLVRMGGRESLEAYRRRFLERYETQDRMVPLLELVDANLGLGYPEDTEGPQQSLGERDNLLTRLVCDALRQNQEEVALTKAQIDLIAPPLEPGNNVPALEVAVQIVAQSREAIDAGEYWVAPSGFLTAMGIARTLGRFMEMLGSDAGERAKALLAQTQTDAIRAELVYPPARSRNYNVLVRPRLVPTEIAVGVVDSRPADRLALDDLWVGLRGDRFFLWSLSRMRRIDIVENHLFNTASLAPNLCRLLALIARDGRRTVVGFPWGRLALSTALPRITYGRLVLSPRQWRFQAEDFGKSLAEAEKTLRELVVDWNLPRYVLLCDNDNRLMIDLHSRIAAALLFDRLEKGQSVNLQEMLPAPDRMWLADESEQKYVAEFVATLTPTTSAPAPPQSSDYAPMPLTSRPGFGPGSEWVYVKLYVGAQAVEELLLGTIAPAVARLRELHLIDRWFFVRYADTMNHLRVRFRARNECEAAVAQEVINFSRRLFEEGRITRYSFDTYDPEYERYGGVAIMDSVERLFTLDSDLCVEVLAATGRSTDARVSAAAESFFPWVIENDELRDLALEAFAPFSKGKLEKTDREELRRLSSLCVTAAPREGLAEVLTGANAEKRLRSLFHMHCNRLGVFPASERRAIVLLRALLLSMQARDRAPKNARLTAVGEHLDG